MGPKSGAGLAQDAAGVGRPEAGSGRGSAAPATSGMAAPNPGVRPDRSPRCSSTPEPHEAGFGRTRPSFGLRANLLDPTSQWSFSPEIDHNEHGVVATMKRSTLTRGRPCPTTRPAVRRRRKAAPRRCRPPPADARALCQPTRAHNGTRTCTSTRCSGLCVDAAGHGTS